jgi:hypothetical protein
VIQLPRRSVTRFFIPLIDVLTLLFCIFLLMPLIKATDEDANAAEAPETTVSPPKKPTSKTPESRTERQKEDVAQSRKERIRRLQENLFIRVVEIDADTGKLFFHDADQRQEIRNQDDAVKLITAHREEAGTRELYYLFLYPRRLTGFPLRSQTERYENWFRGVAHTIDNPRGTP